VLREEIFAVSDRVLCAERGEKLNGGQYSFCAERWEELNIGR